MKALLATVLLLWSLPQAQASGTAAQVFERASPSVYSISVVAQDGSGRIGSGVAVGQGMIVTNHHVVTGARRIYVKQGETKAEAWLDRSNAEHDVALLRVMTIPTPAIALGSGEAVAVGQSVFAIGSPRGLDLSLSEGIVSSKRKAADGAMIQTTAPISPGSSGGGLFDEYGRLVGITTGQVSSGQNLNFAIPVEWLRYVGLAVVASAPKPWPGKAPDVTQPAPVTASAEVTAEPIAEPAIPVAPAESPAPAPELAAPAASAAAAPPVAVEKEGNGNIYLGFALLAAVLLLAKPATDRLADFMSRDPAPPAERRVTTSAPDRLGPFRLKAREEVKNNSKDADLWLQALEETGGDEQRAIATYLERRAQGLYRADLDRKWAAAQAQSQGTHPARKA